MKLIKQILAKENVRAALNRVVSNKGAAGIDGMKVEDLRDYMNENWPGIKQSILERSYKPAPVRRVEILKPNGGIRKLGIPTVVDRTIQQSIVQILTPIFEEEFQENSYGFRLGRSCEQAVLKLMEYLNEEAEWIVDVDLETFFDNVPQDKLMSYVGRVIHAPDTESLIRKYLRSGVMGAVETQWGQPYIPVILGREERRPLGTPLSVSMAPAASCHEGAQRTADSNKSPNDILSKRQDSLCENRANGRGAGTERKCANLTRPRECRMKAESRFPRHFAARHGTPCGRNPLPVSAPRGEWLAKGQTGFARGRTPS